MAESSTVPFEGLKNLVASLNRLFGVLLSQEGFAVRGLKVEVNRQMTLDQKMVLAVSVVVTLEPQNVSWEELEELVTALGREGFQVHYPEEVELRVSLPSVPLAE